MERGESFSYSQDRPIVVAEVDASEMLTSRAIMLIVIVGFAVVVGHIRGSDGPWVSTLIYGSVFLVPLAVALMADLRFPKGIWLFEGFVRIFYWQRSSIDIPYDQISVTDSRRGLRIEGTSEASGTGLHRTIRIPQSFPNFGEIVEVLSDRVPNGE